MRALLVAVDGGQTATKAVVAELDGTVLAAGRGGASDHFHGPGGIEKNRTAIHEAVASALSAARADPAQVGSIGLGLTGAPSGRYRGNVAESIVREIVPAATITIVPDYVTNLAGASGGEPGVVLIAGGGSIAYGVTAEGREALAGGFGYLLGDEGSAFDIGLAAISAACRAEDRRGESTSLRQTVLAHFGIAGIREIPRVVYEAGFARERIALLAPAVAAAAREGDEQALRILARAGHELATTALGVVRQLFQPGDAVGVYLTGGVFNAGAPLVDPFHAALHEGWPAAKARSPRFPPVVGGLILAARAIGQPADDSWLDTVAATLCQREQ
ncbi:MAG: putative N-acetylglucosamine kinase [Thermomicrobiales bacterium]|jgi:glucosamine kinase|nr:putative N-acetylglucosamine kinase [Thermomicrobiales bacterium]